MGGFRVSYHIPIALCLLLNVSAFHEHRVPTPAPTPVPTHGPTHTWEPTNSYSPTPQPTSAPTINDAGIVENIWFSFVDVNRVDVGWDIPTGYDDEGLRITKYEVELRLLRTFVARKFITDLDVLSASFTGLECNSEYRVRVRAWNMYTNTASAAGPWGYSPFRRTRGCPLPAAPSDVTVTGVNKAGLEITWTAPPETEKWGNNVGYYAIRFRPAYQVSGGKPLEWATAKAGTDEVKKTLWVDRHPSLECGLTYTVEIRTVGSKHNKGPWQSVTGSTLPC